ncbi:MAG: saccharopine dehydrogenase C-terminal domain-containing protein [Thermoplasmata archaeon]
MRALVLGAGMMGRAIAYDLCRSEEVEEVTLGDISLKVAREAARWCRSRRVRPIRVDVSKERDVRVLMRHNFDVAVGAVSYRFNHALARAAIWAGVNFCDLGGNNEVVRRELGLHERAREAGVSIIPDCGLAPGLATILAAHAVKRLGGSADEVRIRVGGLPLHPRPPLNYKLVFSPEGLTNEYLERAVAIREGRIVELESLTELEDIEFPEPFGRLEAFATSGGASTLPWTMLGRVRNLDYKTIRYPGHCAMMRAIFSIGLGSTLPVRVGESKFVPRELLHELLRRSLGDGGRDVVLLRVTAGKGSIRLTYQMVDEGMPGRGISAMMKTTAFPASVVAWMLGTGRIKKKGAVPQELCVPAGDFFRMVRERRIVISEARGRAAKSDPISNGRGSGCGIFPY